MHFIDILLYNALLQFSNFEANIIFDLSILCSNNEQLLIIYIILH